MFSLYFSLLIMLLRRLLLLKTAGDSLRQHVPWMDGDFVKLAARTINIMFLLRRPRKCQSSFARERETPRSFVGLTMCCTY